MIAKEVPKAMSERLHLSSGWREKQNIPGATEMGHELKATESLQLKVKAGMKSFISGAVDEWMTPRRRPQ